MHLGIALDLGSTEPVRPQLDRACATVELAESVGFTSVWTGESYHRRPENFHLPAALLVLAHLSARTSLRLGSAVIVARAYQAERLAYEGALLDQLCGGRLSIGLALGNAELTQRFAANASSRPARAVVESMVAHLRRAWRPSDADEEFVVAPAPIQPGGPPLLIGGRTPAAAARAARLADGYYAATNYCDDLLAAQAEAYLQAPAGGSRREVAVTRFCLVTEDGEQARDMAAQFLAPAIDYYTTRRAWLGAEGPAAPELPMIGTPEQILAALRRYRSWGVTSVQLRVAPVGVPTDVTRRSVRLIGERVVPALAG